MEDSPKNEIKVFTRNKNEKADFMIKLLLVGDSGVGKTSLLVQFTEEKFSENYITTIGIDFNTKIIPVGDKKVKLLIWDTAGQERFRTITTAYFRGAMGIILVYDITNRDSYNNITNWVRDIHEKSNEQHKISLVIVGNKADMEEDRVVSLGEGKAMAEKYDALFFETSAKSNQNIHNVFSGLTKEIVKHHEERMRTAVMYGSIRLDMENKKNKRKCCTIR